MNDDRIISKLNVLEDERIVYKNKQKRLLPIFILIPILVLIFSFLSNPLPPFFMIATFVGVLFSFMLNYFLIKSPFNETKEKVRDALIDEFINKYHPGMSYNYSMEALHAKRIIKASNLIAADHYAEEDVLQGVYEENAFYLSEVHLEETVDDSSHTVFKGILFHITFKDRVLPESRIQSKLGLLERWFSGFDKNENYDFWFDTKDESDFNNELRPLFPFIRHLAKKQGDLRISISGNSMTIMMESKMKFLDEPEQLLYKSFFDKRYFKNLATQLNSLFYIVEAFSKDLETQKIEERLELKELEILREEH